MSASNQSIASMAVSINTQRRGARPSTSGYPGVILRANGRWGASVTLTNGTRKQIGTADTPAEAAALRGAFIALHGSLVAIRDTSHKRKAAPATTGAEAA